MTRLPGFAQRVVALDVGLRFGGQRQGLRSLYGRRIHRLAADQSVHVQNMRLGWRAGLPIASSTAVSTACSSCWRTRARILGSSPRTSLDPLAVAARRLKHALL